MKESWWIPKLLFLIKEWSLNLVLLHSVLFSSSIFLYFPFYYVVKIARWRQDIHHLRDDFEKAFLGEEKALTKFDVHWKDIKKDISKALEQSEDQNKKKHLEKQLQKMVFLMFSIIRRWAGLNTYLQLSGTSLLLYFYPSSNMSWISFQCIVIGIQTLSWSFFYIVLVQLIWFS